MSSSSDVKIALGRKDAGDLKVACLSRLLEYQVRDVVDPAARAAHLRILCGNILEKSVGYYKKHAEAGTPEGVVLITKWDDEFMRKIDLDTLRDLEIKELLDLASRTVSKMMKGMKSEQLIEMLCGKNGVTSGDDEEKIRGLNFLLHGFSLGD